MAREKDENQGLAHTDPCIQTLVNIDAGLVLSGGVLTAYAGIGGLLERSPALLACPSMLPLLLICLRHSGVHVNGRLAQDRCLPSLMLAHNSVTGSAHWSILSFLAVTVSLIAVTGQTHTRTHTHTYT